MDKSGIPITIPGHGQLFLRHMVSDYTGTLSYRGVLTAGVYAQLDLVPFGALLAAGYWFRHQGDIHKRLMLLATVGGLMPAPLAHLIGHYPSLNGKGPIIVVPIALFLFASAVYDRFSLGRVHPVSLWGALARSSSTAPLVPANS